MKIYMYFLTAALAAASLSFGTASANWPDVHWEKTLGDGVVDWGDSTVQQTTDGGYKLYQYHEVAPNI